MKNNVYFDANKSVSYNTYFLSFLLIKLPLRQKGNENFGFSCFVCVDCIRQRYLIDLIKCIPFFNHCNCTIY